MLTNKESTIEEFRKMTDNAYTQLNKCNPLHNYDFFKDLLISKKTAEHEVFKGKIFFLIRPIACVRFIGDIVFFVKCS